MLFSSNRSRSPAGTVSLVIPAYNSEPSIDRTWGLLAPFLEARGGAWDVVFVCDGCTDNTAAGLQRLTAPFAELARVIAYPQNRGKGHAVRTGLVAATGDYRIFTDFDLSYRLCDIEAMAERLRGGAEMVIASRMHEESEIELPLKNLGHFYRRHLQGRLFNHLVRALLPIRSRDTQAGLKGMSRKAAEKVLPHLQINGFGFDCELLTACSRLEVPVVEMPVRVCHRDAVSSVSAGASWRMVTDLLRIRKLWNNGPPQVPARHNVLPFPAATERAMEPAMEAATMEGTEIKGEAA